MNKIKSALASAAVVLTAAGGLSACSGANDADVASKNISTDADNFKIARRIVFVNGITDKYLLSVEGYCSIHDSGGQLEVTCKTGENTYKKHFLGLSDNVTYVAEQIDGAKVSTSHYKVVFKPSVIVPEGEIR